MERQVEDYIQSLSDIDLLEYTRVDTHLPEAIEFAKIELADRHLTTDRLAALEKELEQREKAREEQARARAAEPLSFDWRLAVFLCGIYCGIPLLLFIPAWCKLREEGAYQKNKDMWVFAVAGFCVQPILILLRIPPWSWLAKLF